MENQIKSIKVLHVMNGAVLGGISTVVLNFYKHIDREVFNFDCAMTNPELGPNGLALKNMGCKFHSLPLKSKHPIAYIYKLIKILRTNQYNIIHVHSNLTSFFPLFVAKLLGVKIRIAHAHSAMEPKGNKTKIKQLVSRILTPLVATKLVACSNKSSEIIYGKKRNKDNNRVILYNAINVNAFAFNHIVRQRVRVELHIEDAIVLGCVGNLGIEKNHSYALKVLHELTKEGNPNLKYYLLIVGDGPLRQLIINEAQVLGIENSVIFLGMRSDVNEILQAIDIFLMPSLHEGFGIAALEAAASGLPIFLSDKIPRDFEFYNRNKYLSIDASPKIWAKHIIDVNVDYDRRCGADEVKRNGFDIMDNSKKLEEIYSR